MNKLFTLCSILFLFAASASAQTFAFYRGDTPLANNEEFTVTKTSLDEFGGLVIESGLSLKNLTDAPLEARAIQMIITAPPSEEYGILNFCFDRCQEGNENRSQIRSINANELLSPPEFHLSFYPFEGNYTVAKVKYEVSPQNDISGTDKTTVTVTYIFDANSTGLSNIRPENTITFFQDGNRLTFHYASEANLTQLEVYTITGQKIAQHILTSAKETFTLPESLTTGLYVCSFKNEQGIVTTQKLIVR